MLAITLKELPKDELKEILTKYLYQIEVIRRQFGENAKAEDRAHILEV